jgi:hypothetical protein
MNALIKIVTDLRPTTLPGGTQVRHYLMTYCGQTILRLRNYAVPILTRNPLIESTDPLTGPESPKYSKLITRSSKKYYVGGH